MWDHVHAEYGQARIENIPLLWGKFYGFKMEPGQSIRDFITGLKEIKVQLKNVGVPVDDTQLIAKILDSLPSSLRHFLPAWDSTSPTERTLTALCIRLEKEEVNHRKYNEVTEVPSETAFAGNTQSIPLTITPGTSAQRQQHNYPAAGYPGIRSGLRGRNNRGRGFNSRSGFHPYSPSNSGPQQFANHQQGRKQHSPAIVCFYCGETGHIQRTCRHYKREIENQHNWDQNGDRHQSYSLKSAVCFTARRYVTSSTLNFNKIMHVFAMDSEKKQVVLLVCGLGCNPTYDGQQEFFVQLHSSGS